jgi:hypothetical protein
MTGITSWEFAHATNWKQMNQLLLWVRQRRQSASVSPDREVLKTSHDERSVASTCNFCTGEPVACVLSTVQCTSRQAYARVIGPWIQCSCSSRVQVNRSVAVTAPVTPVQLCCTVKHANHMAALPMKGLSHQANSPAGSPVQPKYGSTLQTLHGMACP